MSRSVIIVNYRKHENCTVLSSSLDQVAARYTKFENMLREMHRDRQKTKNPKSCSLSRMGKVFLRDHATFQRTLCFFFVS